MESKGNGKMKVYFKYHGQKVQVYPFQDCEDMKRHNRFAKLYNEENNRLPGEDAYLEQVPEKTICDGLNPNDGIPEEISYHKYVDFAGRNILDFVNVDIDTLLVDALESGIQGISCLPEMAMNNSFFLGAFIDELYDFEDRKKKVKGIKYFKEKQNQYREILSNYYQAWEELRKAIKEKAEEGSKCKNLYNGGDVDFPNYEKYLGEQEKIDSAPNYLATRWVKFNSIDEALQKELSQMLLFNVNLFKCENCGCYSVGTKMKTICNGFIDWYYEKGKEDIAYMVTCYTKSKEGKNRCRYTENGRELHIYNTYMKELQNYSKYKRRHPEFHDRDDYKACIEELELLTSYYQDDYDDIQNPIAKQMFTKDFKQIFKILRVNGDMDEWFESHQLKSGIEYDEEYGC